MTHEQAAEDALINMGSAVQRLATADLSEQEENQAVATAVVCGVTALVHALLAIAGRSEIR